MAIDNKKFLMEYDGRPMTIMEVCGTHTAAINHCGIPEILSPKIKLVSGPGCPVCVTVTAYIDRLIELSKNPGHVIVTFGDMLHVTGTHENLENSRTKGADVRMVYSPFDMLKMAQMDTDRIFIFAAVGFETTTPVYAMMLEEAIRQNIHNVRLLTSLKTMPAAIRWVCENQTGIDAFLAPGHVSVITGVHMYEPIARQYNIPFAVAGFTGPLLMDALAELVKMKGQGRVVNSYPSCVNENGNQAAQQATAKFFLPCDAVWRGFGKIAQSGMMLREEYLVFDAGSDHLFDDHSHNSRCRCGEVLTGKIQPPQCPLFGRECTPQSQQGACMVSREGSCYNYYINQRY